MSIPYLGGGGSGSRGPGLGLSRVVFGNRAFGPRQKILLPIEPQHKDRSIFQEKFEIVRALS
jgi:hypothetical protein